MITMMTKTDEEMERRVEMAYSWYVEALKKTGAQHNAPKQTDIKKTYIWRAMAKFMSKMTEWGIDEKLSKKLLCEVVLFSKRNTNKSTLLMNDQVLKKCLNLTIDRIRSKEDAIIRLRKSTKFLNEHHHELLHKKRDDAWPNVVMWHKSGEISLSCLALSRRCKNAMKMLCDVDRKNLPGIERLNEIRIRYLMDDELLPQCREILGDDLMMPKWRT